MYSYLHTRATSIGRKLQGDKDQRALAPTDDRVYRLCVQGPENCLRDPLAQAEGKREMLGLLKTKGAYAHDWALKCLVREGEDYRGGGRPDAHGERVAVHLAGAALPVGMLRETDYYGEAGPGRLGRAEADWQSCYDLIAGRPAAAEGIARRAEEDLLTAVGCGEAAAGRPAGGSGGQDQAPGKGRYNR